MNISELRKEAESGSVVAQSVLGICYLHGTEVQVDYQEAFRLLSAAAERGAPRAVANLARMYALGWGFPRTLSRRFVFTRGRPKPASLALRSNLRASTRVE